VSFSKYYLILLLNFGGVFDIFVTIESE